MTILATTKRLAVLAAALTIAGLVTLPAQASPFSWHVGIYSFGHHGHHWDDDDDYCLSDDQVVHRIENSGFSDVDVTQQLHGDRVLVQGDRKGATYQMVVDECSFSIHNLQKVATASTKTTSSDDSDDDDDDDDDSDD